MTYTVKTEKGIIELCYDSQQELEQFLNKRFKSWEILPSVRQRMAKMIAALKTQDEYYIEYVLRQSVRNNLIKHFGAGKYRIQKHKNGFLVYRSDFVRTTGVTDYVTKELEKNGRFEFHGTHCHIYNIIYRKYGTGKYKIENIGPDRWLVTPKTSALGSSNR